MLSTSREERHLPQLHALRTHAQAARIRGVAGSMSNAIYVSSIGISTTVSVCGVRVEKRGTCRSSTPCVRTRRPHESERWQCAANVRYLCAYAAYVSIRQHTSAHASIRQHTSAYVRIRRIWQHTQHTSAYVSIRQHTSADVSIRTHAAQESERWQCAAACLF